MLIYTDTIGSTRYKTNKGRYDIPLGDVTLRYIRIYKYVYSLAVGSSCLVLCEVEVYEGKHTKTKYTFKIIVHCDHCTLNLKAVTDLFYRSSFDIGLKYEHLR